jgi:endonuclease/exonuclease/phosphatase family metal-dependent hydrolase
MTRIRLMTYNIRAGLGADDSRSISRIAEVNRAASAQVVCLQEVKRFLPRGVVARLVSLTWLPGLGDALPSVIELGEQRRW